MKIETLEQLYQQLNAIIEVKKTITQNLLNDQKFDTALIHPLDQLLTTLEQIPQQDHKYTLQLNDQATISVDLDYEINELKKDLCYLTEGEDKLIAYLHRIHPLLHEELKKGVNFLEPEQFHNFISDRDGTINNYCGRYRSSIQSIYNAVFLSRFAKKKTKNATILTSAPLDNGGIVDMSIFPQGLFIYAGSKGREYFNKDFKKSKLPINKKQEKIITTLNQTLVDLTSEADYRCFTYIGSGLQFKFGQTTIARQDISQSIPEQKSILFLERVQSIVDKIDPDHNYLKIEDTGLDIEVILTLEEDHFSLIPRDFDKGDGIEFLNQGIPLEMDQGASLICGDTNSDVPMLSTSLDISPKTYSVFVTKDEGLTQKVLRTNPNSLIISEVDSLVCILNELSKK